MVRTKQLVLTENNYFCTYCMERDELRKRIFVGRYYDKVKVFNNGRAYIFS